MPQVEVDTDQLRGAAKHSAAIHDRIDNVLTTLLGKLTATGAAWGTDSTGKKFADGDKGYLAAHDNLVGGIKGMATTFGTVADGQRDAAALIDNQEVDNVHGFGPQGKA
ncbi:WXG100 family type VII secretion target [Nocardia sp. NBC_01499]|uniref:WXG100 family type VII secretion target n=1 Tax=Nocardia sp. NBC_01499 TaxID=2903597 RepID=UPI003867C780